MERPIEILIRYGEVGDYIYFVKMWRSAGDDLGRVYQILISVRVSNYGISWG